MINAKAFLDLLALPGMTASESATNACQKSEWLLRQLQGTSLEQIQDQAGNLWVTLPGASRKTVVLGSHLAQAGTSGGSQLGLAVALETIRAIARREGDLPPCTLRFVIWVQPLDAHASDKSLLLVQQENLSAYLELHAYLAEAEETDSSLGVVISDPTTQPVPFNARLTALCDEAVRELTGVTATMPATSSLPAAEITNSGIPAAVMFVQVPAGALDPLATNVKRLPLLQAAEAFGRWAEATMHLVAGDQIDLWAQEHRLPRHATRVV